MSQNDTRLLSPGMQRFLLASQLLLIGLVAGLWWGRAGEPPPLAPAATATAPAATTAPQWHSPLAQVVAQVSPSVVTVGTVAVKRQFVRNPFYDDFFNRYIVRDVRERVPYVGSGTLIDREGHIVTNHHVIESGESFFVTFSDGREVPATFIDADPYIDVALLKVDVPANELPEPMTFGDSSQLQIGETVIALGNPFGPMIADPRPTVTSGVVSAMHRTFRPDRQTNRVYQDMIQTDAAINPGNSGGPLVDSRGQMVGINTFIFTASGGSHGIGFAIPANRVRRMVEEVRQYGRIRPLWMDFDVITLRGQNFQGVLVQYVADAGPAERAGLQRGDLILSADGRRMHSASEFDLFFRGKQTDDVLLLRISRNGKELDLTYKVEPPPDATL